MARKTPLYPKHQKANAMIVNFGGWDMPLHYGSQLQEHHQVRQQVGMFDISHMGVIDVSGRRVREFLRILLANDVGRLTEPGRALYTCMLNPHGGIIDDLIVYHLQETEFRLVVNAATRERDLNWIMKHARNYAVQIRERKELAMLAIQGPQTRERMEPFLSSSLKPVAMELKPFYACWDEHYFVSCTGYTGEDGFEVIAPVKQIMELWDELSAAGVSPIGLGARDTLRLEAGLNLYGVDMDEDHTPLESGVGWTIAWKPENRDFIGRAALQNQLEQGEHRILVGLVLQGKGVLRNNQTVYVEDLGQGRITSGTFSPTIGAAIALARVPAGVYEQVTVAIRNKQLPALVVKPPFVRHGKVCVDLQINKKEPIDND